MKKLNTTTLTKAGRIVRRAWSSAVGAPEAAGSLDPVTLMPQRLRPGCRPCSFDAQWRRAPVVCGGSGRRKLRKAPGAAQFQLP
ncbi:hypothetical protein XFLAVUS301_29940 [Xanthobacter flavus]|uniref:Uncharacterized protein n=1 Tax=Xanthobacter flavus TaxID=281 RepID=A0A9W6CMW7_XANFL|nr:hypothetical protein XFLAVUS301_29940 [Xanthobacter flavus]